MISSEERAALPLSLLNDYLYCPRRAALKGVEGLRRANVHTVQGDFAHERADLPGYELAKGVLVWRALPVWSERLGLSGKCDIVEVRAKADHGSPELELVEHDKIESIAPVEYKKGRRRQFENDDAQLCAQALCLEEMFTLPVERGAIFHASSKRRREVIFTGVLRAATETAIRELHALLERDQVPPAILKLACEECSLFEICLPAVTKDPDTAPSADAALFKVERP
jgi:CRISPR-associated exonuclease Cas4